MSEAVMAPPSQDTSQPLLRAHPLLGREENMKLLFDKMIKDVHGHSFDADLEHSRARLDVRSERNAIAFDKALDTIVSLGIASYALSAQVGDTEAQQTVSPARTGTPEEIENAIGTAAAATSTANAQVAANIAQLASALVPIIAATSALAINPTQLAQAVLAAITAASGSATANAGKVA